MLCRLIANITLFLNINNFLQVKMNDLHYQIEHSNIGTLEMISRGIYIIKHINGKCHVFTFSYAKSKYHI